MEKKDKSYELKQIEIRLKVKEGESLYSTDPVNCPEAAVKLLADYMKDMDRECVYVLNFDNAMRPISFHLTSMGGSNYAPVDPANIFKSAMLTNASFIMVMHVHPSGSLKPSNADIQSTEKISLLGNFLHIPVRDHLIVAGGTGEYISLKAEMPDIFHEIPDCSVAEPGQLKEQSEEQHTEHTTEQAAKEQGTIESASEKSITDQAKTEETPQNVAEQSQPYDPLALTLDQKEILFVKEAPEAMELAKALESLGNENAGYTPKENDPVRKEWLLNTAQDIKDGNTATIIKAVSDMSETTENIAVTKKAVGFLIKLDAVKGKWEPAPKEVEKLFEQKESPKPEKAADHKKITPKEMTFSQKLESAQKKADAINASRKHSLQL